MPERKPLVIGGDFVEELSQYDTIPQQNIPSGIPTSKLAQSGATNGQVLKWDGSVWAPADESGGGSGEANTASNVGTGDGSVFKEKVGVDLRFRRLNALLGVRITTQTDEVDFATTSPQPPSTENIHTSNFTASKFTLHQVDTSSNAITVTPPGSPNIGDRFAVVDASLNSSVNNITVAFGSQKIYGANDNYIINVNGGFAEFIYMGSATGWVATKG